MKINQLLSERITGGAQSIESIIHFIAQEMANLSTGESEYKPDPTLKVVYPYFDPEVDIAAWLETETDIDDVVNQVASSYFNLERPVMLVIGHDAHANPTNHSAWRNARVDGKLVHLITIDSADANVMFSFWDDVARDIVLPLYNEFKELTKTNSANADIHSIIEASQLLVDKKNAALIKAAIASPEIRRFAAIIVHELTHGATSERAATSQRKAGDLPQDFYPTRHLAQSNAKRKRLNKHVKMDRHFSDPQELDSYVQEIASKLTIILKQNPAMATTIRKHLSRFIMSMRNEIATNIDILTPYQRKYLNKVYRRVYQELEQFISTEGINNAN